MATDKGRKEEGREEYLGMCTEVGLVEVFEGLL